MAPQRPPSRLRRPRRRWLVPAVVLLVLGGSTAAWAASRDDASATSTSVLATVTRGTIRETVSATGTMVPARQADLSFAVSGAVRSVRVAVGDTVHKGQVLATVGAAALRADLQSARASVAAAQSQLSSDLDDGAADAQLAADRAALRSARSARTSAKAALDDATLRATVAGTVASLDLAVGDQVSGSSSSAGSSNGGTGTSGTTGSASTGSTSSSSSGAQVTIISTDAFEVDASVGSSDLASLTKGLQAEITPTGSSETLYGTVSSVGMVAESSTSGSSTFPVTIAVTGKVTGVYAGSSADVSIIVKQSEDVLTVPTAAVRTVDGTTAVTVSKNAKTVVTPITVGNVYGAQTEVTTGLSEGDQVVITTRPLGVVSGRDGEQQEGGFTGGGQGFPGGGQGFPGGGPGQ